MVNMCNFFILFVRAKFVSFNKTHNKCKARNHNESNSTKLTGSSWWASVPPSHTTSIPFQCSLLLYSLHPACILFVSFDNILLSICPTDSGKYLSKYSSFMECNHDQCAIDKLREHFHCLDILCLNVNKVLCKREEVLRHLKWHKKRNESLTHGFLRFSSTDDCSIQFGECQHNGKQTHYHCLQGNCDKVYISTSDVQMHSNYHRKDSAIMQEGWVTFFHS